MPRVEVRLLKNIDEYRQCELVQTHVWGAPGVTREVLSVAQKYGGAVIGTLIDGKVVGFIFAFLAQYHGRLVHWSHMMAVEAKYRDQGFGFQMKLVHRQIALRSRPQIHLLDVRSVAKPERPVKHLALGRGCGRIRAGLLRALSQPAGKRLAQRSLGGELANRHRAGGRAAARGNSAL